MYLYQVIKDKMTNDKQASVTNTTALVVNSKMKFLIVHKIDNLMRLIFTVLTC